MSRVARAWRAQAALALAFSLVACGDGASEDAEAASAATANAPDETTELRREGSSTDTAATVGTIRGRVVLAEGATLPSDTARVAGWGDRSAHPGAECATVRDEDRLPMRLHEETRGLSDVLVTVTGDPRTFFAALPAREAEDRAVRIEGCRLRPRTVGAVRGDTLVFQNRSPLPHLPLAGPSNFGQALVPGADRRLLLERGAATPIHCPIEPHCGRADLYVMLHPVFSVTDAHGEFRIENVPADQAVRLVPVHRWLALTDVESRVTAGGEVEVTITVRPRARPVDMGGVFGEDRPPLETTAEEALHGATPGTGDGHRHAPTDMAGGAGSAPSGPSATE